MRIGTRRSSEGANAAVRDGTLSPLEQRRIGFPWTPEMVERITGCPRDTFLRVADAILAADAGWYAVHTAIREEDFWDKIEELRAAGASEILVSSLDKLLL